ncbi:hypothetical protein HDK64DRAFT_54640 [Phyllosticta capitalensis]
MGIDVVSLVAFSALFRTTRMVGTRRCCLDAWDMGTGKWTGLLPCFPTGWVWVFPRNSCYPDDWISTLFKTNVSIQRDLGGNTIVSCFLFLLLPSQYLFSVAGLGFATYWTPIIVQIFVLDGGRRRCRCRCAEADGRDEKEGKLNQMLHQSPMSHHS